MKSLSRDDIILGNLMGLFLVYSHSGGTLDGIEDELNVRFEKLGYPFDLSYEGYNDDMKIKGLLYRDRVGVDTETVYYMNAKNAPFLRSDVAKTEEDWIDYIVNNITSDYVEQITNFNEPSVWRSKDWRMVQFKGIGRAIAERGIINWGLKKLPISSWDGEK